MNADLFMHDTISMLIFAGYALSLCIMHCTHNTYMQKCGLKQEKQWYRQVCMMHGRCNVVIVVMLLLILHAYDTAVPCVPRPLQWRSSASPLDCMAQEAVPRRPRRPLADSFTDLVLCICQNQSQGIPHPLPLDMDHHTTVHGVRPLLASAWLLSPSCDTLHVHCCWRCESVHLLWLFRVLLLLHKVPLIQQNEWPAPHSAGSHCPELLG